jgi:hypothetical protein
MDMHGLSRTVARRERAKSVWKSSVTMEQYWFLTRRHLGESQVQSLARHRRVLGGWALTTLIKTVELSGPSS